MSYFQAIILGIVQGLTEFLPVSSSGHLVLVPFLLNWNLDPQKAFLFDVLVQLGTLVAVFVYFRQDLLDILKAFFCRHQRPQTIPECRKSPGLVYHPGNDSRWLDWTIAPGPGRSFVRQPRLDSGISIRNRHFAHGQRTLV